MKSLLLTICARGGSKGIPNKNTRDLNGFPLIYYTIQFAKKLKTHLKNAVIELSTDSEEILKIATQNNLYTDYKRPASLATDTAGKVETITDLFVHAQSKFKLDFDYVIDLDVTSPLRTVWDISKALDLLKAHTDALNIFSVSIADKNPYFNMVEKGTDGYFHLSKTGNFLSRQASPVVYQINGSFYIYSRQFFKLGLNTATTNKSLVYLMDHICFDIDSKEHFNYLEWLLKNNKIDFPFF